MLSHAARKPHERGSRGPHFYEISLLPRYREMGTAATLQGGCQVAPRDAKEPGSMTSEPGSDEQVFEHGLACPPLRAVATCLPRYPPTERTTTTGYY